MSFNDKPQRDETEAQQRAKEAFIEEMGLLMASLGLPRMAGRVFGALLLADPPEQSAEELAATLKASRGSISGATRLLGRLGIIDRVGKSGERRDYFRNRPNAWHETLKTRLAIIEVFKLMADKGLAILGSDDPEVQRGLTEMRDYFAYWEKELPMMLERWNEEVQRDDRSKGGWRKV